MPDYDNELRGVLFPAREKKTPKSPDFTGSVTIGGVEYRLAGWKRESKKGAPYLSLTVSKDEQRGSAEEKSPF